VLGAPVSVGVMQTNNPMPIAREHGFLQTHDLAHVSCVGIESDRLDVCIKKIKADRIKGVFGTPSFGFKGSDLNFLQEMPWVEAVWFWDINLKNIDGLYSLDNLQHFGVHPKRPPIDFSGFKRLRSVIVELKSKDRGFEDLGEVELLHIWHFRPKEKSFSSLVLPRALKELQINWANPSSLESLPAHADLKRLEVHRCRSLERLGELATKYPKLDHLVIGACGRLPLREGERVVRSLPTLTHAYFNNTKLV
jgi:hypothetical protein